MKQAYGNSKEMLMFKVNINDYVVESLINDEYLEEGSFNESFYEETDGDYCQILAQPVLDAILDFYKYESEDAFEEGKFDDIDLEREPSEMSDLDLMMIYCDIFENFRGNVEVYWVDPNNPYFS